MTRCAGAAGLCLRGDAGQQVGPGDAVLGAGPLDGLHRHAQVAVVGQRQGNDITQRLGLHLNVFIHVSLEKQVQDALQRFEATIAQRPEVMECYLMTGDADYLLRVLVPDIKALEVFILNHLTTTPGVANIRSSFALKQVRYKTALPLPEGGLVVRGGEE